MSVFKTTLISLRRNSKAILLYFLIFAALSFMNASQLDQQLPSSFREYKTSIILMMPEDSSEFNRELVTFLSSIATLNTSVDDYGTAKDLVLSQSYSAVLAIDAGAEEKFIAGQPFIESYYNLNTTGAHLLKNEISKYLMFLKAKYQQDGQLNYAAVAQALDYRASVKLVSVSNELNKPVVWMSFYQVFLAYVIVAMFSTLVLMVLRDYNLVAIKARRGLGQLSPLKQTLYMSLAIGLTVLLFIAIFMVMGLWIVRFTLPLAVVLRHVTNVVVFSMSIVSLTFLIASFNIPKNAVYGITNIIALGTAFISGAFVPMELLPDAMIRIAQFFPMYYYVKLAGNIQMPQVEMLKLLGMQFLFTICFLALTWLVSQRRRQAINTAEQSN